MTTQNCVQRLRFLHIEKPGSLWGWLTALIELTGVVGGITAVGLFSCRPEVTVENYDPIACVSTEAFVKDFGGWTKLPSEIAERLNDGCFHPMIVGYASETMEMPEQCGPIRGTYCYYFPARTKERWEEIAIETTELEASNPRPQPISLGTPEQEQMARVEYADHKPPHYWGVRADRSPISAINSVQELTATGTTAWNRRFLPEGAIASHDDPLQNAMLPVKSPHPFSADRIWSGLNSSRFILNRIRVRNSSELKATGRLVIDRRGLGMTRVIGGDLSPEMKGQRMEVDVELFPREERWLFISTTGTTIQVHDPREVSLYVEPAASVEPWILRMAGSVVLALFCLVIIANRPS